MNKLLPTSILSNGITYISHKFGVVRDLLNAQEKIKRMEREHAKILAAKNDEIARLYGVIRRLDDSRSKLDMYLQQWILSNGNKKYPTAPEDVNPPRFGMIATNGKGD